MEVTGEKDFAFVYHAALLANQYLNPSESFISKLEEKNNIP